MCDVLLFAVLTLVLNRHVYLILMIIEEKIHKQRTQYQNILCDVAGIAHSMLRQELKRGARQTHTQRWRNPHSITASLCVRVPKAMCIFLHSSCFPKSMIQIIMHCTLQYSTRLQCIGWGSYAYHYNCYVAQATKNDVERKKNARNEEMRHKMETKKNIYIKRNENVCNAALEWECFSFSFRANFYLDVLLLHVCLCFLYVVRLPSPPAAVHTWSSAPQTWLRIRLIRHSYFGM